MHLGKLAKRIIDVPDASDLEYLRQGTFRELVIVLFALSWLVAIRAAPVKGVLENLPVALTLSLGALSAIVLRTISFRAARYTLIASFIGAIALEAWLFPDSPARYYFSVAVVISSLLVSHARIFVIAIVASLIYAAIAWGQGMSWSDLVAHHVFSAHVDAPGGGRAPVALDAEPGCWPGQLPAGADRHPGAGLAGQH